MFVVAWREWLGDYRRCLVVCAVLASAIDTEAEAQMATLEGTVQDGSGGVIASAAVSLREQDTNQSRTALTDGQGIFRFTGVPPGAYDVGWHTTGSNRMRMRASRSPSVRRSD